MAGRLAMFFCSSYHTLPVSCGVYVNQKIGYIIIIINVHYKLTAETLSLLAAILNASLVPASE